MKKRLWYMASLVGFLVVIFCAMASDNGADLQFTVPPAIIGCMMLYFAILKGKSIEEHERKKRREAARRRSLKLIAQQRENNSGEKQSM